MKNLIRHLVLILSVYSLTLLAIGVALGLCVRAKAQDVPAKGHVHGHALHHDEAYRHWQQPGSGLSCCNAREVGPDGTVRGDCYPTTFVLTPRGWRARLAAEDGAGEGDGWVTVPDSRIIREKNPDPSGTAGHLCYAFGAVLCAVPPAGTL